MNSMLKFITCGSVDDGKSTLIGHMLYDAKLIFADQKRALELDSRVGSRNGMIDYSLLLDGLMSEREQGITIDVAYRFFTTDNRSFIVADTPGHEEYTRNMAVGASFADLAVILVDATKGVLIQTKRHTRICALMGIKHIVFAVNKMDLIEYDKRKFDEIELQIKKLALEFDFDSMYIIPVSATEGDMLTNRSSKMSWFKGETLLTYLENVDVTKSADDNSGFYMPVQRVCRPDRTFRGFQGQIESGNISVGDEIGVLPSGENARISSLLAGDKEVDKASKGQAVTICLDKEVDVSRGCVLYKDVSLAVGSLFDVSLLWMDDDKLIEGKNYYLKLGTKIVPATVMKIKYKIDVNSGEHIPAEVIFKNEIARCEISTGAPIVFDKFKTNKELGSFILVDRVTNMTSACGIVRHKLRRDDNIFSYEMDITRENRSAQKNQKPLTLWFTGLSGSGKSTIANAVEKRLFSMNKHTMSLDGDNIRKGLNKNLGFKEQDRIENIRRIAEVSKLMNDAGLIVLTSFISPYAADRENAKAIIGTDNFYEIYISTSLKECERRDVKGLYKKARNGEIPNFTGVSSEYEVPDNPALIIDTEIIDVDKACEMIIELIKDKL